MRAAAASASASLYLVSRLAASTRLGLCHCLGRDRDRGETTLGRARMRLEALQPRQRRAVGDQRLRVGGSVRGFVELKKGANAQKVKDREAARVARGAGRRQRVVGSNAVIAKDLGADVADKEAAIVDEALADRGRVLR